MEQHQLSFHLEEFKALRSEIDQRIQALRNAEMQITVGSFAIYAWLATQATSENLIIFLILAAWIPVGLAYIGRRRRMAENQRIGQLGAYVKSVESKLADTALKGWENQLASPLRARLNIP